MSLDIYLPENVIERFYQYLHSDEYKFNEESLNAAQHWSKRTKSKTETFEYSCKTKFFRQIHKIPTKNRVKTS